MNSNNLEDNLSIDIITCIDQIRSSRFIESDLDIKLLELSLKIARKLKSNKIILKEIISNILYYANYYPEKFDKMELEKEMTQLNQVDY